MKIVLNQKENKLSKVKLKAFSMDESKHCFSQNMPNKTQKSLQPSSNSLGKLSFCYNTSPKTKKIVH